MALEMASEKRKTPITSEEDGGHSHNLATQIGYSQQLHEKFGLMAIIGFSCATTHHSLPPSLSRERLTYVTAGTIMITSEAVLFVYQYGSYNGGPLGSIIGFIFCWCGYTLVALCLGELNSIYPTAGGQYRASMLCSCMTSTQADP